MGDYQSMTVPSLLSAPINQMYVPINHLPGCSILLSGLNDIQHPSYLSASQRNIHRKIRI
jgi:hypothetical protein